jgi:hypothetical protein
MTTTARTLSVQLIAAVGRFVSTWRELLKVMCHLTNHDHDLTGSWRLP